MLDVNKDNLAQLKQLESQVPDIVKQDVKEGMAITGNPDKTDDEVIDNRKVLSKIYPLRPQFKQRRTFSYRTVRVPSGRELEFDDKLREAKGKVPCYLIFMSDDTVLWIERVTSATSTYRLLPYDRRYNRIDVLIGDMTVLPDGNEFHKANADLVYTLWTAEPWLEIGVPTRCLPIMSFPCVISDKFNIKVVVECAVDEIGRVVEHSGWNAEMETNEPVEVNPDAGYEHLERMERIEQLAI